MTKTRLDEEFEERIVDVDVSSELESSFLEYAYSVIYSRALPDARDGLKPVQRRILYTAAQMGLKPDTSHVKSARVVGQVMGQLHPHGDGAIYDALVRLAQPWSLRLTLMDGHGNFGSLDSGPAAMRYTECRMSAAAVAMTAGLDQETVDFRPNYDGKESEPSVLPAAFPNLLVNGSTGIAVGMATNIPPHNLGEVVQALKYLLAYPDASTDDLMRYIPGPDLPTGGKIIGLEGIKEAYESGRGTFKIRANARIEQVSPRRKGIVVTELPYQVGPERIMEQLKALHLAKKITGISDVKDLTDLANGTRLVIEVKNGINAEALLEKLYQLTKLEDSFGINAVALVNGQPTTMGLKQMLEVYLHHRIEVTLRRTAFLLRQAQDRLHLVEGLLLAIVDIDDVLAIIRSSDDVATARLRLMEAFELSEIQANYILDMQLRRLTKFSRIQLESERDKLLTTITDLERILGSETRLHEVIADELDEIALTHGTGRRTVLLAAAGTQVSAATQLEIADTPCWVLLSSAGLLARTESGEPLPSSGPRSGHDLITSAIRSTTRGEYGLLTSAGRVIKAATIDLHSVPITATALNLQGGSLASELIDMEPGERILGLTTLSADTYGWAVGTRNGIVKRTNPEILSKDFWDIIKLDAGDEVVGAVELSHDLDDFVFITSDAQLLHFPASTVRPQGRNGGGIAGINLARDAKAIFFGVSNLIDSAVVTNAGSSQALPDIQTGSVKVTPFAAFPAKGRATSGVRCHRFLKGEDTLIRAWVGPTPVIAAAASGSPIDLPAPDTRRDASGTPTFASIAGLGTRFHV
ncbi:MAG: DNA topoisomerase IV subunit A [Propionibacteriaceae bacterium]|nr:DNA topoisomerase IV subunit A [Propionibacteriaceae bacterium]